MAKLYVAECHSIGGSGGFAVAAPQMPPVAEQTVSIGGTSTQSNAFNDSTRYVRVHTDAICSIAFGPDPTATANSARLAAGQTECFSVAPGHKIAVISNS